MSTQNLIDKIKSIEANLKKIPWSLDIDCEGTDKEAWTGKIYTGTMPIYLYDEEIFSEIMKDMCEIRNALPELLRLAAIGINAEKLKKSPFNNHKTNKSHHKVKIVNGSYKRYKS